MFQSIKNIQRKLSEEFCRYFSIKIAAMKIIRQEQLEEKCINHQFAIQCYNSIPYKINRRTEANVLHNQI